MRQLGQRQTDAGQNAHDHDHDQQFHKTEASLSLPCSPDVHGVLGLVGIRLGGTRPGGMADAGVAGGGGAFKFGG